MIGRREQPRNLVLLLSDMKGFTARTSRQTREENARMMALHDALLLPVLRGFGGRKVKGLGDALRLGGERLAGHALDLGEVGAGGGEGEGQGEQGRDGGAAWRPHGGSSGV